MPVVNNRRCLSDGGPQLSVALAEPFVEQRSERRFLELGIAKLLDGGFAICLEC